MTEARVFAEGALRWAQASAPTAGTPKTTMTTASACPTGLVGYVQAGMRTMSAQTVITISERGIPDHHKVVSKDAPEIQFTFLEAVTANNPALLVLTASGGTVPLMHLELKSDASELGAGSAVYYQLAHCALVNDQWTEPQDGNQHQQTWRALAIQGPTASGYIG